MAEWDSGTVPELFRMHCHTATGWGTGRVITLILRVCDIELQPPQVVKQMENDWPEENRIYLTISSYLR